MLELSLSILVPILGYFAGVSTPVVVIAGASTIVAGVYFIKEREARSTSFFRLTLLLILAVTVMAWMKKLPVPGYLWLSLAAFSTILLDISYRGKRYLSIPFWFFTWLGVAEIFSLRYGKWGYMIGGVVALIAWRDLVGKVQKAE